PQSFESSNAPITNWDNDQLGKWADERNRLLEASKKPGGLSPEKQIRLRELEARISANKGFAEKILGNNSRN
ncbi:hypothetical protein IT397_00675, partial [Candidatus Nomurabacteria bacterium]|nr:hypothetical protein [Candidatus Nomurabacteria bacterium]